MFCCEEDFYSIFFSQNISNIFVRSLLFNSPPLDVDLLAAVGDRRVHAYCMYTWPREYHCCIQLIIFKHTTVLTKQKDR